MAAIGAIALLAAGAGAYGASERASYSPATSKELAMLNELARAANSWAPGNMQEMQKYLRPPILARLAGNYPEVPFMRAGESDRERADYAPARAGFLDVANNPRDDELTKYYKEQYDRSVSGNLAKYGLLGQGRGADIYNQAEQAFQMDARAQADARRAYGAQNAGAVDTFLGNRELMRLGQSRQNEQDLRTEINSEFAAGTAAFPIVQAAAGINNQNDLANFAKQISQPTPLEAGINSGVSAYAALMGAGGGGSGMQIPNYTAMTGTQSATMPGGAQQYSLYGQPQQGIPSAGYSLYGPSYSPGGIDPTGYSLSGGDTSGYGSGGPLSRSGMYRFIYG